METAVETSMEAEPRSLGNVEPPADCEPLLRRLRELAEAERRAGKRQTQLAVGLALALNVARWHAGYRDLGDGMLLLMVTLIASETFGHRRRKRTALERASLVDQLAAQSDPRTLGVLAAVLTGADVKLRERVAAPLISLLSRLRAEDLARLDGYSISGLYALLDCRDVAVAEAALGAIAELAPPGAIPEVRRMHDHPERVAEWGEIWASRWLDRVRPGSALDRVQRATSRCLNVLTEKQAGSPERHALVRATDPPDETTLVQPAGAACTASAPLVRPVEPTPAPHLPRATAPHETTDGTLRRTS